MGETARDVMKVGEWAGNLHGALPKKSLHDSLRLAELLNYDNGRLNARPGPQSGMLYKSASLQNRSIWIQHLCLYLYLHISISVSFLSGVLHRQTKLWWGHGSSCSACAFSSYPIFNLPVSLFCDWRNDPSLCTVMMPASNVNDLYRGCGSALRQSTLPSLYLAAGGDRRADERTDGWTCRRSGGDGGRGAGARVWRYPWAARRGRRGADEGEIQSLHRSEGPILATIATLGFVLCFQIVPLAHINVLNQWN